MATKSKALVPAKGTAIVDYKAMLKDMAAKQAKAAAALSSGSNFASFKGGQLTINGATIPGAKANIIVLAVMQERAYYEGPYDGDVKSSPTCYAYGEVNGGEVVAPHEKAAEPQSDKCKTCEHAQYGSAPVGKGQACKQMQRVIFVAADGKTEAESQLVQAKIPPTSLKNVKGWLDEIGAREAHSAEVITELSVVPDAKTQFQVYLKPVAEAKESQLAAVFPRISVAEKQMAEPYPEMEETPAPKKPAAKKRKF